MSHSTCAAARPVVAARPLSRSLSTLAAGAGVVFYFYYFAVSGLLAEFTHDDLMNLTVSWRPTVAEHVRDTALFFRQGATYRPVGSLFYRVLFDAFGFHSLPYRIACYAVMMANLWLAWQIAFRLMRSRRMAFLVTLLFSYHGAQWPLYLSTGFCYDVLCFFFYAAAMAYYLRVRRHGLPGPAQMAVWSALYILSLGSKEIAVSLPVVMLWHEMLWNRPRRFNWLWREGRMPMLGAFLTTAYLVGRMTGPAALSKVQAYEPDVRIEVFLDRAGRLLSEAFYDPRPHQMAVLVLLLVALPVVCRSKPMRLAFVWMAVGILPIAFIVPRGLAQAYVPAFGLALFLASAVKLLVRYLPPVSRSIAVYAVLPAALVLYHSKYGPLDHRLAAGEGARIRTAYDQMQALSPTFPAGARVLLLDDPFPENDWATTFLVYLHCLKRDAMVGRAALWAEWAQPGERLAFDVVLSYDRGKMLLCDERQFQNVPARGLRERPCIPAGVAYP